MSYKIAVVTDTNSGLSNEEAKRLGVSIVAMPFIIDGENYYEGINLDSDTFYNKLMGNSDISTSQPAIGATTDIFDELLKENDYILYIPMSSALSKTCETATMISHQDEYEGKVYVVDNHAISVTLYHSVIEALQLIKLGKSAKEIKEILESTRNDSSIYLMVDTLKFLKKGGRVTPAAALLGSLLGIKPVLEIQGGKLDAFAKCRTIKSAKRIMLDQIKGDITNRFENDAIVYFVESYSNGEIEKYKEEASLEITNEICQNIHKLSFSVTCHTGPGVIAIATCKNHHYE